jgi:hypothetical protein
MAFSSTVDARPSVMGNLVMLTGTFNAAGVTTGAIALTSQLSDMVGCGANGDAIGDVTGGGVDGLFALFTGSTITIDCVSGQSGRWWALGHRS